MGQDVLGGTSKSDLDHTFNFILPVLRERLILRLLAVGLRNLPKNAPAMRNIGQWAWNPSLNLHFAYYSRLNCHNREGSGVAQAPPGPTGRVIRLKPFWNPKPAL
jgi:hypothetical protein